jgi:hypothetical protein
LAPPLPPWPCASPHGPSRSSDGTAPKPTLPSREGPEPCGPRALAPLQSCRCCPWSKLDLLSWDSSGGAVRRSRLAPRPPFRAPFPPPPTPSRAAVASIAIRVTAAERPLPRASLRASVPRSHPRDPVPSPWFRTTSTVSSARRSRACCIPLPVMGFAAFQVAGFPVPRRCSGQSPTAGGRTDIVPASASHTPRRNPRQQPHHVTVAVAPVPFAMAPLSRDHPVDFEALLRRRVRASPDRCQSGDALSFHGLCSPPRSFRGRPHPSGGSREPRVRVRLCRWRKIRRQPPERHRSDPIRRSDLSLPPDPPTTRGSSMCQETPPCRCQQSTSHLGSRFPCTRHERGRIAEVVGIPSAVHRGAAGSRSSRA